MIALFKLYAARHEPTEAHVAYGIALAVWVLATISMVCTLFDAVFWDNVSSVSFLDWQPSCIVVDPVLPDGDDSDADTESPNLLSWPCQVL